MSEYLAKKHSENVKNKKLIINFLLSFFPASFIAGNLIINTNIILLILLTLFFYKGDIFRIKYYFLDKLIFFLFAFYLFTAVYNDLSFIINDAYPSGYDTILKSLFYLKYLILYLVVRFLFEGEIVNIKIFFISCTICSLFVCFDIFYQFIFGADIFGYSVVEGNRKLSGPFGDELIAGGFIQRFSIFSFFILPIFYANKPKKISMFLIPLLFFIFITGIIFSGNRMPFLLFIFTITMILIFQKNTRKYFLPFIIISSIIFFTLYNFNPKIRDNFSSFYFNLYKMTSILLTKDFQNEHTPQYLREFSTFYDTWLLNKYIGGGIKNFRYYCHIRPNADTSSGFKCNMHPHNYYLEILTETGLIGFSITLLIFTITLYLSIFKKYFLKSYSENSNTIVPFMFLFLTEIFPIKSTGSFFTTGNATYIFLIMAITITLARKYNLIENN